MTAKTKEGRINVEHPFVTPNPYKILENLPKENSQILSKSIKNPFF